MRNIIYIILPVILLLSSESGNAQCPAAAFSINDTVCPLQQLTIDNSSSTANAFQWDFCTGDLDSFPTATALPLIGGTLSYPLNMKMVKENGLYYGFIVNSFGGNYITRYDFGSSPANPPTAVNLNSDPLLGNVTSGIDMVKEGTKWYMFLTTFSGNSLLRYEMDSITQTNPSLVNLNISGLLNPNAIKIIDGYGFITNNQSTDITRLDFGGSYANVPNVLLPAINTGASLNYGIDIAFDCENNKYIGYSTSSGFGILFKLDFGNALSNLPAVSTAGSSLWTANGLQLVKEENNWHIFLVTDNNNFYHFTTGSSLSNPVVQQYTTNFGGIMSSPQNIQMTKVGSDWIGIMPNKLLFSIVRLQFPQGCQGTPVFSADQSPTGISFPATALGYNLFQLEETMANGSQSQYIDSVFVRIPPPEAAFTFGSACLNSPVSFTDSSTNCYGAIIRWHWDFGDGDTSNLSSPSHTFLSATNYTVGLTVYSDNGDSAFVQQVLTVHDLPQAWFTRPDSACAGSDVIFADSSTSNDGAIQIWTWNFGDNVNGTGNQVSHAYLSPSIYQVQLTTTTVYGCIDSVTRSIDIQPGPFANFLVFNTCAGEVAQFLNLTTATGTSISSTSWAFGDGNSSTALNPANNYPSNAANYSVQLISTAINGCSDTLTKSIRIANQPLPWFNINTDTVCTFTSLQFTDSSFAAAGETISSRIWNFGDGTVDSTSLNPSHFYTAPGTYFVSLQVASPDDCDSTIVRSIFVIESPQADFTTSDVCFGVTNNFTDLSTSPSGSVLDAWHWDFGDGDTSILNSTQHTYLLPGTYQVSLVVKSDIGCYDTTSKQVLIFELPTVSFGSSKACTNTPVLFTDSSSVNGSNINQWQWDFGIPGAVSTAQHPAYSFPSAAAYPVSLIATSAQGCSDTLTKLIAIDQTPEFSISVSDQCKGITVPFAYIPAPGSSTNISYLWNFGDSTASFVPNPNHLYNTDGQYPVVLTVTDLSNACVGTMMDTLHIFPLPDAAFILPKTCVNELVQFQDSSSISSGTTTAWKWAFTTTDTSNIQNPYYSFGQTGTFPVQLTITSDKGCKDSVTQSVIVNSLPAVAFTASPIYGAAPLPVQFTNTSDNGIYTWDFGDNSSISNQSSPLHQYNDTGIYHVSLLVTNQNGCKDSLATTIFVIIPRPDLGINGVSFTKVNSKWVMKAIVANTGNEDAAEFELKAQLNGEAIFYNTFNADTLKASQIREYTFNTKLDAGSATPAYFCVEVISINNKTDINPDNDRFCRSNLNQFEIFNVYPNPFRDDLYLGINMVRSGKILISINDVQGKQCMEETVYSLEEGLNTLQLPLGQLSPGVYILNTTVGDTEQYFKISKY